MILTILILKNIDGVSDFNDFRNVKIVKGLSFSVPCELNPDRHDCDIQDKLSARGDIRVFIFQINCKIAILLIISSR